MKPAAARPASPLDPLRSKNASRFGVRGFESSDDHKKQNRPHKAVCFAFGAPAGIRTPDTLLKRQVLCLLSYWGVAGMAGLEPTISESKSGVLPLHYIPIYRPPQQGLSAKTGRHCRPVACLWGGIWGSNPRHPEPQSGALPTELIPPYQFLRREGGQSAAPNLLPPSGVGTPRGIRTPDLLLRRQLLYPAELLAHMRCTRSCGAGDGNRTHVSSLEGWCSTIELHPHGRFLIQPRDNTIQVPGLSTFFSRPGEKNRSGRLPAPAEGTYAVFR